ncbi:AAA family ATPase [Microvirga lotononidis]|uniref:Adenylate/guanylate cyclase family protein n=1 Tax=Microvirga lotononidis TaxID=864069 RepID=I4Z1H8_9HYPH|nr:adenylate/guanylate cyclase domain-containing protein [Microvirga lotononidis]EIM30070.1 adenylate/guanylate cyclase family protein [Microvirga lotononidis]WQO31887.1 adenylate/guanylate cyclase domain-containing protein [Microvirga lotononidis]
MNLEAWLRNMGLERYVQIFRSHDIDADALLDLTEADFKELGVTLGHRKRLLRAIVAFKAPKHLETPRAAKPILSRPMPKEAERRHLSILFCDLVGSTALASRLDPEDMRDVLWTYQQVAADRIRRFEGHVAKYMGDGILAYFGWPYAHEEDAERAVRTGLALVAAIGGLTAPDGSRLACRVGIATGPVIIGDRVGKGAAREEAVIGEAPNLAARLQALAAPGEIVVGAATRQLLGGLFEFHDVGTHELKGFAFPVPAWRVLGDGIAASRFTARVAGHPTPLVGRKRELGQLCQLWTQAKGGTGRLALIGGEPGVGKSRLTQALQDRLAQESHTCLIYQCSPVHQQSVLHPVTTQLVRLAGFSSNDPPDVKLDKLERLLARPEGQAATGTPLLAALLSLPTEGRYPPLNLSPQRQKEVTLWALIEHLARLAAIRPMLMIVEDLHWADPTTLEFLGRVVQRLPTLPVLAVYTFRPEFVPPWTRSDCAVMLVLNRLSPSEGRALVAHLAHGQGLPARTMQQIADKTDGVPLFAEELTKAVLEAHHSEPATGSARVSDPVLTLPDTLQDSLMARLDRLTGVRETAQIGAVIGREFSYGLLAAVARRDEAELQSTLARLVSAGILFVRGQPPDAIYTFKHALVRDAVYATLLRARCRQLHTRVARLLEKRFPGIAEREPETVAQHYEAAGLAMQAIAWWQHAGERANNRSANQEAENHLRRALGLIDQLPADAGRRQAELRLLTVLGRVLIARSGYSSPEVEKVYSRARLLCETVERQVNAFPVLLGLTIYAAVRADLDSGLALSQRLLELARRARDPVLQVEAQYSAGITHHWRGELTEARRHLMVAVRMYRTGQHRAHLAHYGQDPGPICLCRGAAVLWLLGYPDQAAARMRDALALADELAHPFSQAYVLTWAAWLMIIQRDGAGAAQAIDRALRFAEEQQYPYWIAMATTQEGWLLAQQGHATQAIVRINEGLARMDAIGTRVTHAYARGVLGEVLAGIGRASDGAQLLDQAIADVRQHHEGWCEAELLHLRGRVLLAAPSGTRCTAESSLLLAIERAREQRAKAWELRAAVSLAQLWNNRGCCSEARDLLAPVCNWFTEGLDTADLQDARRLLDALG